MPWNEPGGNGKDPWSKRPKDQGPPDLEEVLRKANAKLRGLFGGGSGGGGGGGGSLSGMGPIIGIAAAVVVVGWLLSGFYIVDAGERGLVLRFGAYNYTSSPGPHWHLPYPIETVEQVNVDEIRSAQHEATMLTQDENIIAIDLAVQYRVKDASNYTFKVRSPDEILSKMMESAVREVVGKSKMDFVLSEGRAAVATDTKNLIQSALNDYGAGLNVLAVNLQQAQPPEAVQPAFEDAVKAREDEVRYINEAQSYSNGIIPQARGEAARIEQEGSAYMDKVISRAKGDSSRFSQLLSEYTQAPKVTRDRLYLDAVESVLSDSTKVMLDVKGGNNLLYLPLDKLMQQAGGTLGPTRTDSQASSSASSQSSSSSSDRARHERAGTSR